MSAGPQSVEEVMALLKPLGDPKVRNVNVRNGAGENQFGVKLGDLRKVAKSIKTNHSLGLELWATGNLDAMLLATLLFKPADLSEAELEAMTLSVTTIQLADWLMSYVTKLNPGKEALRQRWMASEHPMLSRGGWSLTAERVSRSPAGLDLGALLDRIETEMAESHPAPQWTMNYCLAEIGINHPDLRDRAINIGERLGVYRNYPVSKGCTSPFAPIWIRFMVDRSG